MDLKHWRDAAFLYKEGGESLKRMDFTDRIRISRLCSGETDALSRPFEDDVPEHKRQSQALVSQGLIKKKTKKK